jgi:hypothetical protein
MGTKEIMMRKSFLILAALLTAFAGQASADFLSADLAGAGGEGFASLVTDGDQISYTILTSGVGTPSGAAINQGGAQVFDLQADFDFGAAAGSVAASAALITQIENNTSAYTLVVQTAQGNLTGTLQNAGDSGGGPGPTPQPGALRFTVDTIDTVEGQTVTVQVSRTGGSSGAVGVSYATASGTATSGADFTAANGTLNWADGDSATKSFTVPITNDTTEEQAESFTATLSNATGGATIAVNNAVITVTIGANDLGPCVASATRLCLPIGGTQNGRFSVDLFYDSVRAGGVEGFGQVKPLDELGVTAGGIITLLDATNPEVLVKVLDACASPFQSWWVFYSATTDLGFTLTVIDRKTQTIKTYTNEDLHPADPVQDTRAFLTCAAN